MTSRACFVGLLAGVVLLVGAAPAASDPPRSVSSYYLGRGDPRLCPSPICGGVWVRLVNRNATSCGGLFTSRECYVASVDVSRIRASEQLRTRLGSLVAAGLALARGTIVRGRVAGFPELPTLVVSEVWPASSAPGTSEGPFRVLRDNGVRCIATPCFSTHGTLLNSGRHTNVSRVDLSKIRTTHAERGHAHERIAAGELIATGRIVRDSGAGPAGAGRALVATQFYVKVAS
ncbi:MAG: DUF6748 domain-containing protein [Gaiellaceae bacterium]